MVFSSVFFLFLFLPLVLLGYYLINDTLRNTFLLVASLIFYAWGEGELVLLMLASISINYVSGLGIDFFRSTKFANWITGLAIAINVLLLIYYKYLNFLVENFQNAGFLSSISYESIALPIGISFFTFQGISYLIDVHRKETEVQKNPLHLGLYIALFPQLIAGPIVRYHDIAKQISKRIVVRSIFSNGIRLFIRGLAKKVIIANSAAFIADQTFAIPANELPTSIAWIGICCYTLQIYFDFSGYSDMAIGLGKMFGFHFRENFNYPYIASSVQEFWRRWHISLSSWFRDYLYIPLGGNRKGNYRTYVNLLIVFFVTGLWHGANWTFIFWGLFHGLFLLLERLGWIPLKKLPRIIRHVYLLLVVIVGWVFFRADTLTDALSYLSTLFGFTSGENYKPLLFITNYTLGVFVLGLVFSAPLRKWIEKFTIENNQFELRQVSLALQYVFYLALFVFSVMELAQSGYNPFIYFRF